MSYKLVDKVFKSRIGLRRTVKAVLAAMATRANDDGTNVCPSIKELALDAGVSRPTAYEAIDKLIALGLITDTGEKRFWGRGHYTCVYDINVSLLDSVKEVDSVKKPESPKVDSVKSPNATQSYRVSDSVLKDRVSERVRERESLASLAHSQSVEAKPNPLPEYSTRYDELKAQGWTNLINSLHPCIQSGKADSELEAALILLDRGYTPKDAQNVIGWTQTHQTGSRIIRSVARVLKALDSDSDYSVLKQMDDCKAGTCRKCKKLGLGIVVKDKVPPAEGKKAFEIEEVD